MSKKAENKKHKLLENEPQKNKESIFTFLFFSTTILGLLFIILNIFLDLRYISEVDESRESLKWILTIISKASATIGLALLLGNLTKLFNRKDEENREIKRRREMETLISEFENKVKDSVVSKDFLCSFSEKGKKEIIAKLLTPNNDSLSRHSNIKEYFDAKSGNYLNFFNINFRSHMNIDIKISKDRQKQKFMAKYLFSYRIYKINEKYERLCIFSEKDHADIETVIKNSSNKQLKALKMSDLTKEKGKYYYRIPEEYNEYNFLIIERSIVEYGHPHWISINWRSLTPIEGITFTIKCNNGIIKEINIFDNEELYDKPIVEENRTVLKIVSSQWLDPYTGICAIIAEPSEDDDFST